MASVLRYFALPKYLRITLWIIVVSFILTAICFLGKTSSLNFQFLPGQKVHSSLTAQVPFSYVSMAETERLIAERRSQLIPIYKIDTTYFETFKQDIQALNSFLDTLLSEIFLDENASSLSQRFIENFNRQHQLKIDWVDVSVIFKTMTKEERFHVFQESLKVLQEITRDGVFPDHEQDLLFKNSANTDKNLKGRLEDINTRSVENAMRYLRIHLLSMDMEMETIQALFRIMKLGIRPNLVFDVIANEERWQQILVTIPKVRQNIHKGATLLTEETIISEEDHEKLVAYYEALRDDRQNISWRDEEQLQNFIETLIIVLFSWLAISFSSLPSCKSKKSITILLTVLFSNLLLIRILLQLTELPFWQGNAAATRVLLRLMPFVTGTMLITLLAQVQLGAYCCILTSIFYALMIGHGTYFFFICSSVSFIAILLCRSAYLRLHILRAGLFSGFIFAIGLFFLEPPLIGDAQHIPWMELFIAPVASGILSGLLTIFCLPILEYIFRRYSDIKIFELYDYNHPLIQQLQVNAPGTYHHSVMMSDIAEQLATIVDANPILCKTAALYHDIGKTTRPEYFIENQHAEKNFHEGKKPEISAIIIRNHVREGIILGKKAKLPRPILDIIQQHHGDSFIRFFHEKAKIQQRGTHESFLDEEIFRYDGPKPQTKEAAIICLTDAIEAVSRTLELERHSSLQDIEALVTDIIQERIDMHQFDECPLTLRDINKLRKALSSILLSALHTRIRYDAKNYQKL
ncbi:MAG: HDIG domain-containing protein [Puniceicoccales bacterium]|nr:HDIG domain-containing protein [Puniceicoccales bacterium]